MSAAVVIKVKQCIKSLIEEREAVCPIRDGYSSSVALQAISWFSLGLLKTEDG